MHRANALPAEPLAVSEALHSEPQLNPAARAVARLPWEGRVDNRALLDAALAAAAARGVALHAGAEVAAIEMEGRRCVGVRANGERVPAGTVVVAAGCYSVRIAGVERFAPVRPVRGQMVALRPAAPLAHVLRCERGYIVPREDGRVVAGSTLEDAGFEKRVTPEGLAAILSAAVELVPSLAGAEALETWSGLRPDTPDHLPVLGPTDIEGLLVATGHYRNGILLAPITAQLVREWILEGKPSLDAARYSPLRFARSGSAREQAG
jgi:glycine oxidase